MHTSNAEQDGTQELKRCAGVFLHPTSLPSRFGVGDLGPSAIRFVELLSDAGQKYWQICPLGPTGYGDSPYQCLCSFAGNPILISPQLLEKEGLIKGTDLEGYPPLPDQNVDFKSVHREKTRLFAKAFSNHSSDKKFASFCKEHKWWLDDFAMFVVIKERNDGRPWYEWDDSIRRRDPARLKALRQEHGKQLDYCKFLQFLFYRQWSDVREFANKKGVEIIGDIPYYVSYDSSDAWANPELFELGKDFSRKRVGGVPPDYFSENGQLWGNPLYRWDVMAQNGFAWWKKRIKATLAMVDLIRIDHFRAFESFWAVDGSKTTAKEGEWVSGPGMAFFNSLREELGALPLIAEDLGDITDDVRQLVEEAGLPGMKVLQFAFDKNVDNLYLPYNIPRECVVYTGTHDNNTSLGWYHELPEDMREYVRLYLGCADQAFLDYFLRLAYSSPGRMCIVPMQDILGLDESHRFNTPGTGEGNWQWRFRWDMLEDWMIERVKAFTELYGRSARSR